MKNASVGLIILGLICLGLSALLPTSIHTNTSSPYLPSDVMNFAMMQRQMWLLHAGLGAIISGCILFGFASLIERMDGRFTTDKHPELGALEFNPRAAILGVFGILVVVVGAYFIAQAQDGGHAEGSNMAEFKVDTNLMDAQGIDTGTATQD